ncbi:ABC transporter ATP-binding protein [Carnobacterium divergens]|uniref:Multidrug ABC transporter ATP-binding protein n=1 Tax=Carnobacterium divergens TaxID=2748 RepID=A0A7Z8G5K2_CARDV|nr:ABC transporter ATP-binding protein [Carnobacterium divergens]TFI75812.1 multidrug ABC transporter ATP-binding protein [Carnobacterium divergens]TFI79747.1 multidrug ABC transporter ATP-binding protein [Carnobacterium divergens]TFI86008.1 multidrug ABC transporter ATP-binding protein [Carnobacterium divergens]TFI98586.1 multidrug ABC transporter ATP-binding protein [Carnobacterium divergens]TFJ14745.1 multidrug ABC transporter ATP-binding protein [Carnobacterium divergens]
MLKLAKRMSFWAVAGAILFMIVQVVSDLYLPTLTSDIINNGVAKGDVDYIWSVGLKMLGFSLISIAAATGNVFLAARQSQKLGKTLRSEVYKKVTNFTNDEFDEMGTSSLITRTTNDVVQVQNVVMMFLRMMIMAPIMLIGASFLAYSKDGELTKIFLYVLPILAVFMGVIMYFAVPLFKSMQKKTDKLNLVFREGLTGIRVIRAFNRSKSEAVRFDEANKDFTDTSIKVNTIMSFMLPVMTFVMSATNIAIIWYGGHYIADGTLEVGNLIAFMTYAMQILMSFMMLSMVFVFIPRGQASAVRINEVLNMESKIKDPKVITKMPTENRGTLDFNHVDFRYEGAERLALKDIDFHGRNGQTVAIIGGTGSGKSSLSNLIPRFYDVESGSIEINGVDIRQMSQHELRDAVGFVPQKAMLFTGTIRENIQYGKKDATDEEIWHALEIAQSKEFVEELPNGLDSYVEQGGGNFSGGQKQRLCIARALIKKADIFVFDDSFSALDFKTDAALRKALKPETKEAVVVIVAQRISTVVDADLILVLDEGELVGMGTHEELKETNATYQEIISSQLREEEI